MKQRLHTLQHEIAAIEDMVSTLSGPMLDMALEELKNLQFELDMLNRQIQKKNVCFPLVERSMGLYEISAS